MELVFPGLQWGWRHAKTAELCLLPCRWWCPPQWHLLTQLWRSLARWDISHRPCILLQVTACSFWWLKHFYPSIQEPYHQGELSFEKILPFASPQCFCWLFCLALLTLETSWVPLTKKHVCWLDATELANTLGIYSQRPVSLAVGTHSLYSVWAQLQEHGMHIVTCFCCNLFELLGGDLPLLCFQGKKTTTLDDKKLLPQSHFFSESFVSLCLCEVEHHPSESSHHHQRADPWEDLRKQHWIHLTDERDFQWRPGGMC